MGKDEIARKERFLLFRQWFLLNSKIVFQFVNIFDIISLFAAKLEESKIGMWDKGLRLAQSVDVYFRSIPIHVHVINHLPQNRNSDKTYISYSLMYR